MFSVYIVRIFVCVCFCVQMVVSDYHKKAEKANQNG